MTREDRYAMELALCHLRSRAGWQGLWSAANVLRMGLDCDRGHFDPLCVRRIGLALMAPVRNAGDRETRVLRVRLALLLRALLRDDRAGLEADLARLHWYAGQIEREYVDLRDTVREYLAVHEDLASDYDELRDAVREYFDLLDHGDEHRFVESRARLRGIVK